ncbi:MAG: YigZ family protein [Clostridia bacterium]|nr:YigZ family protein [Clostridia bacterium]
MEQYKSVLQEYSCELIEKKSKFIGYISPIENETQATSFLSKVKNKYWDAKHHVYAYILKDGPFSKSSDDGEPSGTAGIPILNVIKSNSLVNTMVVVARYFGGILLGAGGLLRAYSQTATMAVNNAKIATYKLSYIFRLSCTYEQYNKILLIFDGFAAEVDASQFLSEVFLTFHVAADEAEDLKTALMQLTGGNLKLQLMGSDFFYY